MDAKELGRAPLPPHELELWDDYLRAAESGRRHEALDLAGMLVDSLDPGQGVVREAFTVWLCEALFDRSCGWLGQFGGGLSPGTEGFTRGLDYALSAFPLTSRIVVPYVTHACTQNAGRDLRWLFQCLIGLSGRLPERERNQLTSALLAVCGDDAAPLDALRAAARGDDDARRWIEEIDEEGSAIMTVLRRASER